MPYAELVTLATTLGTGAAPALGTSAADAVLGFDPWHLAVLVGPAVAAIFRGRFRERVAGLRENGDGSANGSANGANGNGSGHSAMASGTTASGIAADREAGRIVGGFPRLLEVLLRERLITAEQAHAAAAEQRRTGDHLSGIIVRLGLVSEDDLFDFLSRKYGMPVINLERLEIPDDIIRLVKREIAHKHGVLPIRQVGNTLTLAISDPTVVLAIDDVQFATGLHVIPVLAPETAIREAIDRYFDLASAARIDEILKTEPGGPDAVELLERSEKIDITQLEEQAGQAPVIRFVNLILADAIRKRASDIHLEPYENVFVVRYRIDGVLHDVMAPPKQMEAAIVSRVKIMANMDIAERRLPQDGRISVKLGSKQVDLRVSSLPTISGEKVVLRILDKTGIALDLAKLGFEGDDLERFRRAIQTPYGMVLVTGPTGSGKSTTLYAAVQEINSPGVNIVTAEDPIELNVHRVNQLQVRDDIGLTFSAALRSFLRQDPDVILVGEIRDSETAQIAIRAALTGHFVLSTLHTNNAPSAVVRLLDMGIAPFLVSSSLLMVVAQRLCRRICPECREPAEAAISTLLDAGFNPEEVESARIYRGAGCGACANTGYRGRTAIHEVLSMSPEIQDAVVRRRSSTEIGEIAVKHGMRTLRDAGLRKVVNGVTTLDEVIRVTHVH
jgi:type IV pilus assembly protein PilB